jgi:peptidoglycan/xylan/chitin deacetylase (PgdA/CDA1 family)
MASAEIVTSMSTREVQVVYQHMLRTIGKTCLACAYTWTRAGEFLSKKKGGDASRDPFIVCYHRVVENFETAAQNSIPSMLVSTAMFERHVDWLARRFRLVSLDDIALHLEFGHHFSKPAAAITFDDGYADVYRHAYPVLKRKGIPAAIFVVTGLVGTGRPQIFDYLYLILRVLQSKRLPLGRTVADAVRSTGTHFPALDTLMSEEAPFAVMSILLKSLPGGSVQQVVENLRTQVPLDRQAVEDIGPLTWDMIETMKRNGMTFGSHTKSHSLLTRESVETVFDELVGSKQVLETRLGSPVRHFAYPDGQYNPAVVEAVKASGYRYGYGICQSRYKALPLFTIRRKVLWQRSCLNVLGRFSPAVMNCHAYGVFDRTGLCTHNHSAA